MAYDKKCPTVQSITLNGDNTPTENNQKQFKVPCESSMTVKSSERQCKNGIKQKFKHWERRACPPRGKITKYITCALAMACFLGAMWSVFPEDMLPNHNLFGLVVTIILCIAAEALIVKIPTPQGFPPIPPLFASLLMGLMLRNLPAPGNIDSYINPRISIVLRKIALTIILTRAGLEIEPEAMKKVKWAVLRLAFCPCIAESCLIGIFGYLILHFPILWSFMLGFVIAAVSPAVVVPSLIIIQNMGWGVEKGVPTLAMAASGIDDVLAITGFTILLGIAVPSEGVKNFISMIENLFASQQSLIMMEPSSLSTLATDNFSSFTLNESYSNYTTTPSIPEGTNDIAKEIGSALIEITLGIVSGLLFGFLISYIPSRKMRYKSFFRGFLLLSIGIFMVFSTDMWQIGGAGTLCALIMSFTASLIWKKEKKSLAEAWEYMWIVFQPILFGLTGALVEFSQIDGTTLGLGFAVLAIGLFGRLATSTAVTFGQGFTLKEKIFVSVTWIPKGTVQAALGSAAFEKALSLNRSDIEIFWGQQILVLAVLITLITAPLGSFGISFAGPRLLHRSTSEEVEECQSESDVESHDKHSRSSSDTGIASKASELPYAGDNDGRVNFAFEKETDTTSL